MSVSVSFDPTFLRLQTLVAGRFSLERELGRGGMGIVYLARDIALERPVAIKLLAPELSARSDMRVRFLREARIAAQCFHPHIVPIHAVEEGDGLAWIVMSYVRGETVAQRLRRTGPLSAGEVRRLAREVGWALSYAHQRGVVHRDIKPENLLIDASTDRYLIADFGIAHHTELSATPADGVAVGTARYMAPEQALGEPLDGRADLYALGVTLFFAATGRLPFAGATTSSLLVQTVSQPAPSVQQFAPALPLSLVRAIDRCLAKSADARYADAGAFLAAVEPDVRAPSLSPALRNLVDHARAAKTMVAWTIVASATTGFLMFGEGAGSLGRAIFSSVGTSIILLFASVAAFRGSEAFLEVRRLLKRGHGANDVASALAGADKEFPVTSGVLRGRTAGVVQLATGVGIALGQGLWTSGAFGIFEPLVFAASVFLPPMLIARGAGSIADSTPIGAWIHKRVTAPLARFATRMLHTGLRMPEPSPVLDDAPTEILLVNAVQSIMHDMPERHRLPAGDAGAIARSLADKIAAMRQESIRLDLQEAKALERRDPTDRAEALKVVRAERAEVQQRLHTSMTVLESLRLDLLRLVVDQTDTGLTTNVEAARDIQRQVNAVAEVRHMLKESTPV